MDDIVTTIYKDISSTSTRQLYLPAIFFKSTAYLRFVSDDTVHYTGFKLTFIAMSEAGG